MLTDHIPTYDTKQGTFMNQQDRHKHTCESLRSGSSIESEAYPTGAKLDRRPFKTNLVSCFL